MDAIDAEMRELAERLDDERTRDIHGIHMRMDELRKRKAALGV